MSVKQLLLLTVIIVSFVIGGATGLHLRGESTSAQTESAPLFRLTAAHWCKGDACSLDNFSRSADGLYYSFRISQCGGCSLVYNGYTDPEYCPDFDVPSGISGWYASGDGQPHPVTSGQYQVCEALFNQDS